MPSTFIYSRSELCSISQAPEDAVVFWDRQGLLVGTQLQPRAHKRYDCREVLVAALLNELRRTGLNVGVMRSIISELRSGFEFYDAAPRPKRWLDLIKNSDPHQYDGELARFCEENNLSQQHSKELRAVREAIPFGKEREFWAAVDFYDPFGRLAAWPDEAGEWHLGSDVENAFMEGATTGVVINWEQVRKLRWPDAASEVG